MAKEIYYWIPVNFVQGGGWYDHSSYRTKKDAMDKVATLKRGGKFAISVIKDTNNLRDHQYVIRVR